MFFGKFKWYVTLFRAIDGNLEFEMWKIGSASMTGELTAIIRLHARTSGLCITH